MRVLWHSPAYERDTFFTFGAAMCSGDLNGDGCPDLVVSGDSYVGDPVNGKIQSRAYVYSGGPDFDSVPDMVILHDSAEGGITSLACVDVNADGFDDLVVGDWSGWPEFQGSVRVYLGGNPMDTAGDYRIIGPSRASGFGVSVASAGDVNGDGHRDLIVGACDALIRPGFPAGKALIYYGGPGFDTTPDVVIRGGHEDYDEYFGITVTGGSDLNQDGFDDVAVGAVNYGPGIRGRLYVYFGAPQLDTGRYVSFVGEGSLCGMGACVDMLRNAGGGASVVAGAQDYPYHKGTGYIFWGGAAMDSVPDVRVHGRGSTSCLGFEAARAGDIDHDGRDEVMFGDVEDDSGQGALYFYRTGSPTDTIPIAWVEGTLPYDCFGANAVSIGDANGDGEIEIATANYFAFHNIRVTVCAYVPPGGIGGDVRSPIPRPKGLTVKSLTAGATVRLRYECGPGDVELRILDRQGRIIKTLLRGRVSAGSYELDWDADAGGSRVPQGIYFADLVVRGEQRQRAVCRIVIAR